MSSAKLASPTWLAWSGTRRVMAEFKHVQKLAGRKESPVEDLEVDGDKFLKWTFKLREFDTGIQGENSPNQFVSTRMQYYGALIILLHIDIQFCTVSSCIALLKGLQYFIYVVQPCFHYILLD